MLALKGGKLLRDDGRAQGKPLDSKDRERIIRPYLPSPAASKTQHRSVRNKQPIRSLVQSQLYLFVYTILHTFFSLYLRLRVAYHALLDRFYAIVYYHHHTPELILKDVKRLTRMPHHLSVILEYRPESEGGNGIEGLIDDLSEICAWTASAEIPILSVYEKTGILKNYIPMTHKAIMQKLSVYFGSSNLPTLQIRAPNQPAYSPSSPSTPTSVSSEKSPVHLNLLLISASDGRETLVDLTKTLTEMSQHQKLSSRDISLELIDTEISESVMSDPDLMILFSPNVKLLGYPPWQIRLTEIYHVQDNEGVEYHVFLRALHKYGKAQMRFGR